MLLAHLLVDKLLSYFNADAWPLKLPIQTRLWPINPLIVVEFGRYMDSRHHRLPYKSFSPLVHAHKNLSTSSILDLGDKNAKERFVEPFHSRNEEK